MDFEQVIYNVNANLMKKMDEDAFIFKDMITEEDVHTYQNERTHAIQLAKNADLLFNIELWDICFASSWEFPNDLIGFCGQWMEHKLSPLASHLQGVNKDCDSIHICYRRIEDNDEHSLDYFCDTITFGNRLKYAGRRSSGNDEDNIVTYNRLVAIEMEEGHQKYTYGLNFKQCNMEYEFIENNPIRYICPSYKSFYLDRTGGGKSIDISNYSDIEDALHDINNKHSYLYNGEQQFELDHDKWLIMIDKIKTFYDKVGHDKPFWTAYLHENIDHFEEVRVLLNCGNFLNIIARSKRYIYFMQRSC